MKCKKCNATLPDYACFCLYCGESTKLKDSVGYIDEEDVCDQKEDNDIFVDEEYVDLNGAYYQNAIYNNKQVTNQYEENQQRDRNGLHPSHVLTCAICGLAISAIPFLGTIVDIVTLILAGVFFNKSKKHSTQVTISIGLACLGILINLIAIIMIPRMFSRRRFIYR